MKRKTRGEAEAEIAQGIIKFEKDYLGRGPLDARTFFINDMVLIRLRGLMTPAETKLAENENGLLLVKDSRRQLFESCRSHIYEMVEKIIGCQIISMHTDMSTWTGERVIILTVNTNLDTLFENNKESNRNVVL